MNLYILSSLAGVTIASFSQVLLKKSSQQSWPGRLREYLNAYVICGYGLMFIALLFAMYAYRGLDYTNVPLLESTGYIIVLFLSFFFFKEKISLRKALGMLIILVGIFVYYL